MRYGVAGAWERLAWVVGFGRGSRRWRSSADRQLFYAGLALHAAEGAAAAAEGGHKADARMLLALSDTLASIGRSPDGNRAVNMLRAVAG